MHYYADFYKKYHRCDEAGVRVNQDYLLSPNIPRRKKFPALEAGLLWNLLFPIEGQNQKSLFTF